jgi:hypothetical protein
MKSTWFGTRDRYDFARLIREADYGMGLHDLFREFLQCAFSATYQPVHKLRHGEICPKEEETYMRSIGRLKYPNKFGEAMGALTLGLEKEGGDFLGMVMSELDMNDVSFRGQCFTPKSVCELMATSIVGDAEPDDDKAIWLSEPACGAGAMTIACSDVLKGKGFLPWHYRWVCTDVDVKCFQMIFIQTTLLGIPAGCVWGNTLTLETHREEWNLISVLHRARDRKNGETSPDAVVEVAAECETVEIPKVQLEMF